MRMLVLTCWLAMSATTVLGQTTHDVSLTWQDLSNPSGTAYNVYRGSGNLCSILVYSQAATAVTTTAYSDTTVTTGNYCYYVTAVLNGIESKGSNRVLAQVPAFPPTDLAVTVGTVAPAAKRNIFKRLFHRKGTT